MRKQLSLFFLLLIFIAAAFPALAQADEGDIPPRPKPPRLVNDFANLLRDSERRALEQKLVNYNDSTSTQIAVVTIKSLGPYDIADYAYRIGETWGIGGKGKNNGILILIALNERRMNISTGYGMEHVVPDAIAKRIIERTLKPAFQQGNYYQGLDNATSLIISMASGEYQADAQASRSDDDGGGISTVFIIILIIVILIIISRKGGGGGRGGRRSRTLGGPFIPPVVFGDFSGGRGIFGGGGGGFGGGGGGGFGGFGGGSFGGGGASGSW